MRDLLRLRLAGMQKFTTCVDTLRQTGRGYLVPDDKPIHGVGHSNGALLHLLIGSIYAPASASNVLISFNNKCALSGPIASPHDRSLQDCPKAKHALCNDLPKKRRIPDFCPHLSTT